MLKEIHEQPKVVRDTLEGRLTKTRVLEPAFGVKAPAIFDRVKSVTIVACGSSFYTASIARYWIESVAELPCHVEIASEYRYRGVAVPPDALFVTISQSGETADTLAALRMAKTAGYAATLTFCNVATSSIVRESDLALMLEAGPEIGVASTKAFTAQLVDLVLLTILLARRRGLTRDREAAARRGIAWAPRRHRRNAAPRHTHCKTRRAFYRSAPCIVPGPRIVVSGCVGRRAQAEGNLVHPRRGVSRRRVETRAASVGR